MGSLTSWITELLSKALHQDRNLSVGEVQLGDHCRLGFRLRAYPVDSKDVLLADPNRLATSARHGGKVSWVLVGGGLYPSASFSVPVGPAAIGFSADAELSYTILAPYPHGARALGAAATQLTVIPFRARDVTELEEGTELIIRGTGNISAAVSSGSASMLAGSGTLITVTLSTGLQVVVARWVQLILRVKKLAGSKVLVSVTNGAGTTTSCSLGIVAAASLNVGSLMPSGFEDDLSRSGRIGEYAVKALPAVNAEVGRWLQAHLELACSQSNAANRIAVHVFDLGSAEAATAFESAMRLETSAADAAARRPGGGVRGAESTETWTSTSTSFALQVSRLEVLSCLASVTESHGLLRHRGGEIVYERVLVNRSYRDIISRWFLGKLSVTRELLSLQRRSSPVETYLHVRCAWEADYFTSADDVKRFVNLVGFLGTHQDQVESVLSRPESLRGFGKTDRTLDVFVSPAGMAAVLAAGVQKLQAAHAAAFEKLDGRKATWMVTGHPSYRAILELLELGPSDDGRFDRSLIGGSRVDETSPCVMRDQRYRGLTGGDLGEDSRAYKECKQLTGLLGRMSSASTPAERARAYAEAAWELGLRFERELAMIASVAGPGGVIVAEASVVGTKQKLAFQSNGQSPDPMARLLDDPS